MNRLLFSPLVQPPPPNLFIIVFKCLEKGFVEKKMNNTFPLKFFRPLNSYYKSVSWHRSDFYKYFIADTRYDKKRSHHLKTVYIR